MAGKSITNLSIRLGYTSTWAYFCTLYSNAYYSPHRHAGLTTHLIRQGTLTITYPEDNALFNNGEVKKETFGVGARVDVPAGKLHEVWIGEDGCEYVIGE